jgi:hypothetical protein
MDHNLTTVDEFESFFPLVIITIKRNETNELENRFDIQMDWITDNSYT